jgi:hypothetical protein
MPLRLSKITVKAIRVDVVNLCDSIFDPMQAYKKLFIDVILLHVSVFNNSSSSVLGVQYPLPLRFHPRPIRNPSKAFVPWVYLRWL